MIGRSIKIIYFYLENYAPLYESLGINTFEFSRTNSNNSLVLILGGNGSGKSFLINELTPIPLEHVAYRNTSRIIPGKNGKKIITYLVDNSISYTCEIYYSADKKTQCFFKKQILPDEEIIELNPNGNVTSYLHLLESEFGLIKSYTNIGYFSSSIKSIVDMTPKERYDLISNWLPNISEPLQAYKYVQKKYNTLKKEVDLLTKDITKITVDEYKQELDRNNYALIDREEQLKKIRQYISEGNILLNGVSSLESSKLISDLKKFKEDLHIFNIDVTEISELVKDVELYIGEDGKDKLKNDINDFEKKKTKLEQSIENNNSTISRLKSEIDTLTTHITNNNSDKSLNDILTSIEFLNKEKQSLKQIKLSLEKNNDNLKYIDNDITNIISQILSLFYEIYHIINKIKMMSGTFTIIDIIQNTSIIQDKLEKKENEVNKQLLNLSNKIKDIEKRILILQNNGIDLELINKAPSHCTANTCPIMKELLTYIKPEEELQTLQSELDNYNQIYTSQQYILEESVLNHKKNIIEAFKYVDQINDIMQRNSQKIGLLPDYLLNIINVDSLQLLQTIEYILEQLKTWNEYYSVCDKYYKTVESLKQMEQLKTLIIVKNTQENNLTQYSLEYEITVENRNKDIIELELTNKRLLELNSFEEKYNNLQNRMNIYITNKMNITKRNNELLILNKRLYYKKHAIKLVSDYLKKEKELVDTITLLKQSMQDISNKIMSQDILEKRKSELLLRMELYDTLMNIWSPRVGYPSLMIQMFLDTVKDITNRDLKEIWGGALQIKDFTINNNEFSISFQKGNVVIDDISEASGAERATLSIALSVAIIEVNSLDMLYNIIRLDESDAAFDETRRQVFLDIITTRLDLIGCQNCYVITHNNMFENIEADVILLPNAKISTNYLLNKNILFSA